MCPAFLQFWSNVIHCKSAYKNGFHCYLCPCMLEHVCYKPFSLKTADLDLTNLSLVGYYLMIAYSALRTS